MTTFDPNIQKFITKKEGNSQFESYFASDVFAKLAQEAGLPIVHSDTQPTDTGMLWFDPAGNTQAARTAGEGGYKWFDGTAWVVTSGLTPAQIKTLVGRNVPIDGTTITRNSAGALQALDGGASGAVGKVIAFGTVITGEFSPVYFNLEHINTNLGGFKTFTPYDGGKKYIALTNALNAGNGAGNVIVTTASIINVGGMVGGTIAAKESGTGSEVYSGYSIIIFEA